VSDAPSPNISPKALEAEQARLARFFEAINKHWLRSALPALVEDLRIWLSRHGVEFAWVGRA
jgi:hypothetical protein